MIDCSLWRMKDNPHKRRVDRRFLSSQKHEIDYVVRQFARAYPHRSKDDIRRILEAARHLVAPSENRARILLICDQALRASL